MSKPSGRKGGKNNFSSRDVTKHARKNGLQVVECKGGHKKVIARNSTMVFPGAKREISKGLCCKINKWFIIVGIPPLLFIAVFLVQIYLGVTV